MDDLISRQAAIDALIAEGRNVDSRYLESERIIHESDAVEAISMLPSAERTGHWEIHVISPFDGEGCRCSECGTEGATYWDYCPNCGADMRGNKE